MNEPFVGNFRLCLSVFRVSSFSSSVSGILILVVPYVYADFHVSHLEYCVITSRFIQVTSQCQNIETKPQLLHTIISYVYVCIAYEYSYIILVGKILGKYVLARLEIYRYNIMISCSKISSERKWISCFRIVSSGIL